MSSSPAQRRLAALLLFLSGGAALVYQTLWVRQLTLVVGVDVYAVSTGVAAFFAGLAVGSALFGRLADRSDHPFRLYAVLELGVAVLGVGATIGLGGAAPLFVHLRDGAGVLAWLLPFALVGLPAVLMGGTLPLLTRALEPDDDHVGGTAGALYAWNTAGAICGVLAAPFLLAPALGFRGAAVVAGFVNLGLAAFALGLDRRRKPAPVLDPPSGLPSGADGHRLALGLYAVAGGLALGYELVWTQLLVQFLSTRAFAFAVVLATYLLGLAIGSALFARASDRSRNPWIVFGLLVAAGGASAMLIVGLTGSWLSDLQSTLASAAVDVTESQALARYVRFAVASTAVVLVPTILLGAAFPAAVRLSVSSYRVGRGVGAVAAWNIAGGVAGTFLVGFVAIPILGIIRTLWLLTSLAAVVGLVAVVRGLGRTRSWRLQAAVAATAAVVALGALVPHDKLARLLEDTRGGTLVHYDEGAGGTVAVLEQPASAGTFRRLYISGVSNSGDTLPSVRYMRLQALLPLMIHRGEPRSALVIALGTGITCGALLADEALERRVCVELLAEVVAAAALFEGNFDVTRDPRIDIRVGDGRHLLLRDPARYDLITLEPPPPSASGVANLYSREFYELARDRLNPDGLVAQWWPLATQNHEDSQSIVRSMLDVFPHLTAWTTELHEVLLVGSMAPIELDASRVSERMTPSVVAALDEVGVGSLEALLATWVTDREGLADYAGSAPPVTDDHPVIEYGAWLRDGEISRVLRRLAETSTPVPVESTDPFLAQRIEVERRRLWTFYGAGLAAYAGDREGWAAAMERVLSEGGDNAYFQWFLGESARRE